MTSPVEALDRPIPKAVLALTSRLGVTVMAVALVAGLLAVSTLIPATASKPALSAPTSPPVTICGNASELTGPSTAPTGSVTVPAGLDSGSYNTPSTTYYFATGTHTLGTGEYNQIIPGNSDTYIGAPGAVLNGQYLNNYAFTQQATNVTVEYLTIEDFGDGGLGADNNEFVVNHDSGSGWTIEHNTVENNAGAGVGLGSNSTTEYNCLTGNGQYGFSSYAPAGIQNVTLDSNEISYNDSYNWEVKSPGCGCSGGGKFWNGYKITADDNYVHNNANVGIWADTDNSGITVSGNYISANFAEAVMIEISYNFAVTDNTIVDNDWGNGAQLGSGFPGTAIYISESGYDSRAPDPVGTSAAITGNVLTDNWGGVVLWENSNRFCGALSPDNAGSLCTLVNPAATSTTCDNAANIAKPPLFSDCRWKTQNVSVTGNTFSLTAANVPGCTSGSGCGTNGLFSEWGSTAPYNAWEVPIAIANSQNDHFADNTYCGPWQFDPMQQGVYVTFAQWQAGYPNPNGANATSAPQDTGSTLNGSACSGGTTTTTSSSTTTSSTTTSTTMPTTTTTIPVYSGPVIDAVANVVGTSSVTTPAFSTTTPDELVIAEVSGRGSKQSFTVSGAGLTWTQVASAVTGNEYAVTFDAETLSTLSGVTVTAKAQQSGNDLRLQVATAKT